MIYAKPDVVVFVKDTEVIGRSRYAIGIDRQKGNETRMVRWKNEKMRNITLFNLRNRKAIVLDRKNLKNNRKKLTNQV